ncbi:IS3 family transposase [Spirosoma agri]|uniref:IS3 family transposase n=1 Tax=Spirosoma agri TaxID=1987381 RepID=A0A6M0IG45_9BACT|nr:IS3 family transposase [Spirosoma agri]NEU67144.1 IS3 family transposase [Spirosoma agri]
MARATPRYRRGDRYQLTQYQTNKQQLVEQVFVQHKRRYGSRRITAELKEQGCVVGRHQVRRIMKQIGLQAIEPRSFVPRTTNSTHGKGYWSNLLLDQPLPKAPNLVCPGHRAVSDITYLPLVNGEWAYLAVWMDLYSRKVVGWQVGEPMKDELVVVPLRRALQMRQPAPGLVTHSDRGGQYVSAALKELIRLWHSRPSMSRATVADDPYDNAFAESLWIGLPKQPPKGGVSGRGSFSECGRCTNRNLRLH